MIRCWLLSFVGVVFSVGASAQIAQFPIPDQEVKREFQRLQGSWAIEQLVNGGNAAAAAELQARTIFFSGEGYVVNRGGQVLEVATQELDPTQSPKSVTVTIVEGPRKGDVLKGIYELQGDTLRVCFNAAGDQRPSEFKSEAGSDHVLAVYKRIKPSHQEQVDITGAYDSETIFPDGSKITSDVVIERAGDAYTVTYRKNGEVFSVGTAIRTGNLFSMCWLVKSRVGIAVYQIESESRLVGQFTAIDSAGVVSQEIWTRKQS